jgi:hypothetical protein
MKENSILIGVVVFILIVYLYNCLSKTQTCKRRTVYFDHVFEEVPQLNVVEETTLQESMDNGNHIQFIKGGVTNKQTNLTKARWNSTNSQPERDNFGRMHLLESIQVTPGDFNPTVRHKEQFSKNVNHNVKMNTFRRATRLEGFSYNENSSQDIINSDRDNKALNLHMPSVYD